MPELSNLLRERLGIRPVAGVHLDPDQLTAFSENALGAAERSHVAEHLSACAYCREVLAVALPPIEPQAQPVAVPLRKRAFWRMPAFGMAASAAAIALIAATFFIELPKRNTGSTIAQNVPAAPAQDQQPNPPALQNEQPQAPKQDGSPAILASAVQPPPAPGGTTAEERDRVNAESASRARSTAPVPVETVNGSRVASAAPPSPAQKHDYVNVEMFSTSAGYQDLVATSASNAAPQGPAQQSSRQLAMQAFLSSNQPQALIDIPANANQPSKSLKPIGPVPSQRSPLMSFIGGSARVAKLPRKIGPAITAKVPDFGMHSTAFGNALQGQQAEAVSASSAKSSNGNGNGALPESEAFTPLALAPRGAIDSYSASASSMHWKIASGKLMKSADASQWQEAYDANVPLTFVTTRDAEVWAGGAQATLLHSSDRGQHWETFRPDNSASGDVVAIELAGNNVRVKTSANQSWLSQDGGKSWFLETSQQ